MPFFEKLKSWFKKNKKYIIIGGAIVLTIVSAGVGYVIYNNNKKIPFSDWIKNAPTKELDETYEIMRSEFCKTGTKPFGMEQISQELGERGAQEWFAKHPRNTDPNFRWTDANRWDRD